MMILEESADLPRLNVLKSVLEAAGLHPLLFDGVAPYPGVFPSRLMIPEDEESLARRVIREAEV
ncbi:MAG: hypothetical protein E7812_00785 [Phenylobacterium sp.]|nr:MAG: hypothetical protein E7812_00785 [Phenylobacterium sp.]